MLNVRRYKNNSLHFIYDKEDLQEKKDCWGCVIDLLQVAYDVDCEQLGDVYNVSNYEMGLTLYSYYSDTVYYLNFRELCKLLDGKVLILHDSDPNDWEREGIEKLIEGFQGWEM